MSNDLVLRTPSEMFKYLEKSKSAIERALPKHINPDRMLRLALTCFSTTPKLRECTAQSILASIVTASQLGLEIGVRGQGYLIPYKTTCTFVPGWMGLVGLLNNTGRATAWTGAVFEGDEFSYSMGSNPHIEHRPGPNSGIADKLTHAYACGKVNGSEIPVQEVWDKAKIFGRRDQYNKVGKAHYSFTHPEMYARKVVLLQVLKYMPCSVELTNAVEVANRTEDGGSAVVDNGVVIDIESSKAAEPEDNVPMGESASDKDTRTEEARHNTETVEPRVRFTKAIRALLPMSNLTEAEFIAFMVQNKALPAAVTSLDAAPVAFLQSTHDQWGAIMSQYQKAKKQGGKLSPQAQIEAAVLGAGLTFNQFNKAAEDQDWYPDATSVGSFAEIPSDAAGRLTKNLPGIVQICKAAGL